MNLLFEIKPTKQMVMYRQELAKLRRAGLQGKIAQEAALKEAGRKYKHKASTDGRKQLSWNFGTPDLSGQHYLDLEGGEEND